MVGQGLGEGGARLHLRCLSACGDSGHLDWTARASEEVAGFLVATVFVFWALRDSVLAADGCSLLFLNSILLYFSLPWCNLCIKKNRQLRA